MLLCTPSKACYTAQVDGHWLVETLARKVHPKFRFIFRTFGLTSPCQTHKATDPALLPEILLTRYSYSSDVTLPLRSLQIERFASLVSSKLVGTLPFSYKPVGPLAQLNALSHLSRPSNLV